MPEKNKYLQSLDDAWAEHLKPRAPDAPTVISLFAGCGGSSLGYSMAGFRELLAVEWDAKAVETFRLNFPEVPVWHGDICKLTVQEILDQTELRPGELDVLDGSPPCQGFSTAGKREFTDDRNQLFREYLRILKGLKPRAFVIENVSGMVKGKMKLIFVEILKELKAAGYEVRAWILNAKNYGVPQSRDRLIFIGARKDLNIIPSYPKPQPGIYTVRDAIGHLPTGIQGKHSGNLIQAWIKAKPNQSLRKSGIKSVGSFQSVKLNPDTPGIVQTKSHTHWHYKTARKLNQEETALLGSFPGQFKYTTGKFWQFQIGNSVPPLFMKAIALHVWKAALERK